MKKYMITLLCLGMALSSFAQLKDFSYKFYGQLRTDLFYNSRANDELVDGLFYMYPKDRVYDENGKDLNSTPNGSMYTLYSRLGVDVAGPKLGNAKTSAKVEIDFRGSGSSYTLIRIRHAYFNLDWGKSALLVGQYSHPLFGDVSPRVLNLSVGAPFQPFSRAPQIRYRFTEQNFMFTGVALWQMQYTSIGPKSTNNNESEKSHNYLKNSCIPEIYLGADYKNGGFMAGVGIELLSLKPRTQATTGGKTYKVDERITTLSYEAHAKYTNKKWFVGAKTVLGSNLTQASGLGGFGIQSTDAKTGEREYTPITFSSSWLNVTYGQKWKPGLFVGYAKNLGASNKLDESGTIYGVGTHLDQLVTASAELTYNVPNWKFGLEYIFSSAWYGDKANDHNKWQESHAACNNRLVAAAMFTF